MTVGIGNLQLVRLIDDLVQPPGDLGLDPPEPGNPDRRLDAVGIQGGLTPRRVGLQIVDVVFRDNLSLRDGLHLPVEPGAKDRWIAVREDHPGVEVGQLAADEHLLAAPEQIAMYK